MHTAIDPIFSSLLADGNALAENIRAYMEKSSDELTDQTNATRQTLMIVSGLGMLAGLIAAIFVATVGITRPLDRLVRVLQRMAQGEIDAAIRGAARRDEIGAVGKAVEGIKVMVARKAAEEAEVKRLADAAAAAERRRTMIELADGFERAVGGIVEMVSSSATELQATPQTMTSSATETASQSTTVAAAAEEASANVQTVAAAAEELGTSVQEIGRHVLGSASLAQTAVGEANQTQHLVQALSEAATRIGDMVGLISNIAGQTNLLALNATIEAARAGEAGREETGAAAAQALGAAGELSRQSEHLGAEVSRFLGTVRAA